MSTSQQDQVPTNQPNVMMFSGVAYPAPISPPQASRAVFVTEGVNQIKGPSRLEYVPYQRTIIQYQPVETVQYIPVERKVIEYEERKRYEQVPIQETVQDFYTVEHLTEYVPHVIPEKKIEYVPVEKIQNRVQYYPVQRQLVYYPGHGKQYNTRQEFYQAELKRLKTQIIPSYGPPAGYQVQHFSSSYQPLPRSIYGYSKTDHLERIQQITTYTGNIKDYSYLSPIDFTRQNISPRVSRVSAPQQYQQIDKKSRASQKNKKSHHHHHKKHHDKKKY